jgi:hypothetical protein
METVFACDVDTQETHYVVYDLQLNYQVFDSVCDAISFIKKNK